MKEAIFQLLLIPNEEVPFITDIMGSHFPFMNGQ